MSLKYIIKLEIQARKKDMNTKKKMWNTFDPDWYFWLVILQKEIYNAYNTMIVSKEKYYQKKQHTNNQKINLK